MKHNFLKSLDLPKTLGRQLPSIVFDQSLTQWINLRAHELERDMPDDYRYYVDEFKFVVNQCWKNHDARFNLELNASQSSDISDEHYDRWSFEALNDYPARVLSSIAQQFGWRLIPHARWVALHAGAQSLAHYVEHHCRKWSEEADVVFHLLQGQKLTRQNAESQIALIRPIRQRAVTLFEQTVDTLRRYHT